MSCRFSSTAGSGEDKQHVEISGFFHTKKVIITSTTNLSELYNEWIERFKELISSFMSSGTSGWTFSRVEYLDISINPFQPLNGSSYIKLPPNIGVKEAIINVKNENDNECFKWAVTSAVFPVKIHPERLTKTMREKSENFDWTGSIFPMELEKIGRFEKRNPKFSINVFGFDEGKVYPLRCSKKHDDGSILIDLFFFGERKKNNHYCWIRNSSQVNKHKGKLFFHRRCLNSFRDEKALEKT